MGSPPSPPPLLLYLTYSSIVEQILLLHSFTKTPSASFVSLSPLFPSLSFSLPPSFLTLHYKKKKSLDLCHCVLSFFFSSTFSFFCLLFLLFFLLKICKMEEREMGIMGEWDLKVHYKKGDKMGSEIQGQSIPPFLTIQRRHSYRRNTNSYRSHSFSSCSCHDRVTIN